MRRENNGEELFFKPFLGEDNVGTSECKKKKISAEFIRQSKPCSLSRLLSFENFKIRNVTEAKFTKKKTKKIFYSVCSINLIIRG